MMVSKVVIAYMRYAVLSVAIVLLIGAIMPHAFSEDMIAQLGTNFDMISNQTTTVQPVGIVIHMINMSDSRCPSDVTCIWAGQAKVNLEVRINGNANLLTLTSTAGGMDSKSLGNYVVQLIKISPYPTSKTNIKLSDYVLTLKVSTISPLQQFKSGIAAKNVICMQGFVHVVKANGGSPACVKSDTASKLVARGWALSMVM